MNLLLKLINPKMRNKMKYEYLETSPSSEEVEDVDELISYFLQNSLLSSSTSIKISKLLREFCKKYELNKDSCFLVDIVKKTLEPITEK